MYFITLQHWHTVNTKSSELYCPSHELDDIYKSCAGYLTSEFVYRPELPVSPKPEKKEKCRKIGKGRRYCLGGGGQNLLNSLPR